MILAASGTRLEQTLAYHRLFEDQKEARLYSGRCLHFIARDEEAGRREEGTYEDRKRKERERREPLLCLLVGERIKRKEIEAMFGLSARKIKSEGEKEGRELLTSFVPLWLEVE